MSWGAVAVGGATLVAQYMSERERSAAAARQASAQAGMSKAEIAYRDKASRGGQERFERLRGENIGRLSPYSEAGGAAQTEQAALMGLSGQAEQEAAMARFSESPGQRFLRERQEKALLRSQAAIGGLGGGNVRTALQEQAFGRAQTDYDRQLQRLGDLSGRGLGAEQTVVSMGTGQGYTAEDLSAGGVPAGVSGQPAIVPARAVASPLAISRGDGSRENQGRVREGRNRETRERQQREAEQREAVR